MKIHVSFSAILLLFMVSLFGFDTIALGQSIGPEGIKIGDEATPEDDETVFGLDEDMSERLLSSLRKGAFSKNDTVCYQSLLMFSKFPEMHQKLGEGVQLELVKKSFERDTTRKLGYMILVQSEISGIERQELLLDFFKSTFRSSGNSRLDYQSVLQELVAQSDAIVERFANEIDQDPLGEHADKLLVIEHLGPSAEKAIPALLKRYHAVKALAAKEGRLPNYMDLLFTIGEIQSKDAMEIILDACEERGSDQRVRYAVVGFECLKRVIDKQYPVADNAQYKKYVEAMMKKYDTNSDGLLAKEEMAKMPRSISMSYDRNRDGQLTRSEFLIGIAKQSKSRRKPKQLIRNSVNFD